MPWHALNQPSLALGILRAETEKALPLVRVTDVYANLAWADFLERRTGDEVGADDYEMAGEDLILHHTGDWIFTSSLYGREWMVDEYAEYLANLNYNPATFVRMHRLAAEFVDDLSISILTQRPDLVGFTTTFQQNVPSLAVARRLKQFAPHVKTVFGGGNCDGIQGPALQRNFAFVDFAVSGDGERSLPALVQASEGRLSFDDVPGLAWDEAGAQRINSESKTPISEVCAPNYDTYFTIASSRRPNQIYEPMLLLESARGCWWGEFRQCTFCGLNGSSIEFRAKPAEQTMQMIEAQSTRHRVLRIQMADNIIAKGYFDTLLPKLADSDVDYDMFYDIKSNIDQHALARLARAGVTRLEPGIESLSTHVLRLMDKGVNGPQNVALLRDCELFGISTLWNILYGFDGETVHDYENTMKQIPALVHMRPPAAVVRVLIERFSPFFDNPELGFSDRRPADVYRYIYDLENAELEDLVYLFDAPQRGIEDNVVARLQSAVSEWRRLYEPLTLTCPESDGKYRIQDRRPGLEPTTFELDPGFETEVYRVLAKPATAASIVRALARLGIEQSRTYVAGFVADLRANSLVFTDDGGFTALTTPTIDPGEDHAPIQGHARSTLELSVVG